MFLSFSENFTHVYTIGLYYNFPFCQAPMPLLTPPRSILTLQTSCLVFFFHYSLSPACAAHICVGVGHSLKCGQTTGNHTTRENRLSVPRKPPNVPQSEEEAHEHPFPKLSGLIFTSLVQAATASVLS